MELNDKVKVIAEGDKFFGRTGKVSSLLDDVDEKNIGVDIDLDYGDPTPVYYSENELEIVKEPIKEDNY